MTAPATAKDAKRKPIVYIVDDDDGMRRALTVLMTTVGWLERAHRGRSIAPT